MALLKDTPQWREGRAAVVHINGEGGFQTGQAVRRYGDRRPTPSV